MLRIFFLCGQHFWCYFLGGGVATFSGEGGGSILTKVYGINSCFPVSSGVLPGCTVYWQIQSLVSKAEPTKMKTFRSL